MSEKRQPNYTLLLRKQGKRKPKRIELFNGSSWRGPSYRKRYRIRVEGKWFPKDLKKGEMRFYTIWEFRDMLMRTIIDQIQNQNT